MPIRPENKKRYPANWEEIRKQILERAGNKCEWCGAENHKPHPITKSFVRLTIAHLDHTPENCDFGNLRALCQKCHNNYDQAQRIKNRWKREHEEKNVIDLFEKKGN